MVRGAEARWNNDPIEASARCKREIFATRSAARREGLFWMRFLRCCSPANSTIDTMVTSSVVVENENDVHIRTLYMVQISTRLHIFTWWFGKH